MKGLAKLTMRKVGILGSDQVGRWGAVDLQRSGQPFGNWLFDVIRNSEGTMPCQYGLTDVNC